MTALTIYTSNFRNYDVVFDPACIDHPYFCFTDTIGAHGDHGIWRHIVVPNRQRTPQVDARWHKLHPHVLFPHSEWTLYHDASLSLIRCPLDFAAWCAEATGRDDVDLYLFSHPERDCLYDEAEACARLGKDTPERMEPQLARYRQMGFPRHAGMWQAGILLRRNTPKARAFHERWWSELAAGSHRDQLSLPVAMQLTHLDFATLPHEKLTDWFAWRADHSAK